MDRYEKQKMRDIDIQLVCTGLIHTLRKLGLVSIWESFSVYDTLVAYWNKNETE